MSTSACILLMAVLSNSVPTWGEATLLIFLSSIAQSPAFAEYFAASEKWLRPYAVFKVLQALFGTAEHWHWGVLSRPTPRVRLCLSQVRQAAGARFSR